MKVIAYLTEPASYTLDLIESVHIPNKISYKFLFNNSEAHSKSADKYSDSIFLNNLSIIDRYNHLKKDYKKYDALIFNGYDSVAFLLLWVIHIFSKEKKPIAIESDTPLKVPKNIFKRLVKSLYLNYLFKNQFLHALAGGNKVQKELFRFYGMPEKNIHFLPMVVDVNRFKFQPSRQRNPFFGFIFVGRFIPLKQIDFMISEFLLQFKNNMNVQFTLIGDGECYNDIYNKYSKFKNIIFKGRLYDDELINEFKLAHVLILASNNENWGLVFNEAMSAAIPVLSNKGIGANYDLIEGKDTGLIFDSSLKGDLSKKMNILYKNKSIYSVYSKNAFSLMHDYWNFDLYSKQLKLALLKMLDER